MYAYVRVTESLPGLYEAQLVFEGRESGAERILYLPDLPESTCSGQCDPVPSVSRANRAVRKIFGMCDRPNLLEVLSVEPLPRFDDYDEVYGFAYALKLLEPFLRLDRITGLADGVYDGRVRAAMLDLTEELRGVCPAREVFGGQRRMECAFNADPSYQNRPLSWLCVSKQKKS